MADFTQYTDANGTTHTVKDAKAVRQFSTMPSASDYSGKVVVYTGTTTSDYTKGHRYLSDGTNWTDYEEVVIENTLGLSVVDGKLCVTYTE